MKPKSSSPLEAPLQPGALADWPVFEEGLLMAHLGPVLYVHVTDRGTPRALDRFARELDRALQSRVEGARVAALYEIAGIGPLIAARYKDIARVLEKNRERVKRTTAAICYVTDAPSLSMLLRLVYMMAPPPCPYATERDLERALVFLLRAVPDLPMTSVLDAIRSLKRTFAEKKLG